MEVIKYIFKCMGNNQQHTTLHTTAGLLLKLSRVGPGQFLDGRPDSAGSGFGGPLFSLL
jgi:cytochrome c peroxidase